MAKLCIVLLLCLWLAGCGADPTPFPADVPAAATRTPAAQTAGISDQSTAAVIRYALAANTRDTVADLDLLRAAAQVETLTQEVNPADLGTRYDIIAAYGDLPGGVRSPVVPQVALLLNTTFPPLSDNVLLDILRGALDKPALVDRLAIPGAVPASTQPADTRILRQALANAGWPDGLALQGAVLGAPGWLGLQNTLQRVSIDSQWGTLTVEALEAALRAARLHLALVLWTTAEERAAWATLVDEAQIIDLYSLPISYLAIDGLSISFTPGGWPLATR